MRWVRLERKEEDGRGGEISCRNLRREGDDSAGEGEGENRIL